MRVMVMCLRYEISCCLRSAIEVLSTCMLSGSTCCARMQLSQCLQHQQYGCAIAAVLWACHKVFVRISACRYSLCGSLSAKCCVCTYDRITRCLFWCQVHVRPFLDVYTAAACGVRLLWQDVAVSHMLVPAVLHNDCCRGTMSLAV